MLQTDGCNDGVGGIFSQKEAGLKHPVTFASKKMLPDSEIDHREGGLANHNVLNIYNCTVVANLDFFS